MPSIRYFTVTQEREIKVAAANPDVAVALAMQAFDKNSSTGVSSEEGRITSTIVDKAVSAREDY